MLGKADFAKSGFLAANGCDIQPLLRLTPLLEPINYDGKNCFVFVSATLGVPGTASEAEALFRKRIDVLNARFPDCLQLVGEPRTLSIDDFDYRLLPAPPELSKAIHHKQYREFIEPHLTVPWGAEFTFARGKGGPVIKLFHIAGEAVASYWMLSHGGTYPPKLLSTVQAGDVLQARQGAMEELLSLSKRKPTYWVKGFWQPRYSGKWPDDLSNANSKSASEEMAGRTYAHVVQRYPQWDSQLGLSDAMDAEVMADPSRTIVATMAQEELLLPPNPVEIRSPSGRRIVRLIHEPMTHKRDAVHVVSRRVKKRWGVAEEASNVICWEDIFAEHGVQANFPACTLAEALRALTKLEGSYFRITPVGFEDEGFEIARFLAEAEDPPLQIDIHLLDPADFIDLRRRNG